MEEEEKVARRKRKWSYFRSSVNEKRMAKDIENVKDAQVIKSPGDASKSFKFTEVGSDIDGGNYSEGGIMVGVRQPMSNTFCERSLSPPDKFKYGTSRGYSIRSMGPEPTAANLVVESIQHPDERDSGQT